MACRDGASRLTSGTVGPAVMGTTPIRLACGRCSTVPGTMAIWLCGSNALSTAGSIGPDLGAFRGVISGDQTFPVRVSVTGGPFWASAAVARPSAARPPSVAIARRKVGLMTVLRSHALVVAFPTADLGFGFLMADAVAGLDLADELLAPTLALHQILAPSLPPLPLPPPLDLRQASID